MLGLIVNPKKEKAMPQQLLLFDAQEPTWAERLRQGLGAEARRQVIAILAEMARTAVESPLPRDRRDDEMKTDQVTEAHHARVAYVYIRQSSPQQVLDHTHRESTPPA